MRALAILGLLGLLGLGTLPRAAGKGLIHERLVFPNVEPEREVPWGLMLAPALELGPMPSAELPDEISLEDIASHADELPLEEMRATPTAPYRTLVGLTHGAMLDRCRFRMRSVAMIGHGASPDGRPAACRLLMYVRRMKIREASLNRKPRPRLRFRMLTVAVVPSVQRYGVYPGQTLPVAAKLRSRTYSGTR